MDFGIGHARERTILVLSWEAALCIEALLFTSYGDYQQSALKRVLWNAQTDATSFAALLHALHMLQIKGRMQVKCCLIHGHLPVLSLVTQQEMLLLIATRTLQASYQCSALEGMNEDTCFNS